ncbi:MAG: DUF502 domain-containing protein [Gammaproteobacteria bacterium]|nr:hypothetical protein [Gammaproteobacteria bacterium]
MRRLRNTFLKGLAALLPVALTIFFVYWLATTLESIASGPLRALLPEEQYWPGLGLLVTCLIILIVGVLVDVYLVQRLWRYGESVLARIPIVKTIFGALKDFTQFLPAAGKGRDLKRVVVWRLHSARLIGFVTEEEVNPKLFGEGASELVAVYFPMSYQIGGYTLYVPKHELHETALSVEEAMRLVLIGGVSSHSSLNELGG